MSKKKDEVTRIIEAQVGKRTKPFPHQVAALKKMQGHKNFAVFAEQGTGKTKIAIDRACQLHEEGKIETVVVISPKEVHRQWAEEQLPEHCWRRFIAYAWKWSGAVKVYPPEDRMNWICTYFDSVRTEKGMNGLVESLHQPFLLIIDEGHRCKERRTLTWAAVNALSNHPLCASRLLLTGTPIAKHLVEEWSQFNLLDPLIIGIRSQKVFETEYEVDSDDSGIQVKNLERFQELTGEYSYRIRKADMKGMPEKTHMIRRFNMTQEQREFYLQMALSLEIEIESGAYSSASTILTVMQKLQQISNGFVVLNKELGSKRGNIRTIFEDVNDNPRIKCLKDVIAGMPEDEQVVIWCRYIADCQFVEEALGNENCFGYHGGIPKGEKDKSVKGWLNKEKRFLVATPASGGTGLNLQVSGCTTAIYYSNSENSIQRWQSEDRIHRIGTKGTCTYFDLVARKSRDEEIIYNLQSKKALSALTLDDIRISLRQLLETLDEEEDEDE